MRKRCVIDTTFDKIKAILLTSNDTLAIVFDNVKRQMNVTEAYYCRQLWLYNLTIVIHGQIQSEKNVFIHSWLESENGEGSNEIASCLVHFFKNIIQRCIIRRRYRHIHFFSDSCPAQNKNTSIIAAIISIAAEQYVAKYITLVKFLFPVRGHSYLPADRVLGCINKELRTREEIGSPQGYYEVYRRHGRLFLYNQDWQVYNYKELADSIFEKKVNALKLRTTRVRYFPVRATHGEIGVSDSYGGIPKYYCILKSTINNIKTRRPKLVPRNSHVSAAEKEDVQKLLKFVKLSLEEENFYKVHLAVRSVRNSESSNIRPIER